MKRISNRERNLRILTNSWTVVAMFLFILDFYSFSQYSSVTSAVGVIYIAILGLYVGTKEFYRWHEFHDTRHIGEIFVIVWTAVLFLIIFSVVFINKDYHISGELIAVYTAIIGIFALTQNSKIFFRESKDKSKS